MEKWTSPSQEEKTELNFEKIAKLVPLIIGFFIICGSLHLATYYQCFHVNIFNYLDTTEILTTFLYLIQDIVFIFSCLVGYMLVIRFILWAIEKRDQKIRAAAPLDKPKPKTVKEIFQEADKVSSIVIVASLILCLFYVIRSCRISIDSNYIIKDKDWMRLVLILFTSVATLWITAQLEASTKRALKNTLIFFALFFISYAVCRAVERIEVTVNEPDLNTMIVVGVGADTVKTSPNYFYVGRTNKYVFFYDVQKQRADVFPQDKITKMSFSFQKP